MNKQEDIANVLIADRDPDLAQFLLKILARKGIRGHLVGDKENALAFVEKGRCDFLFTSDIINPQASASSRSQDGFKLLSAVKANWPELPVVMITYPPGSQNLQSLVETTVKAVHQGCCDFLVKPLEAEKVETLLDTFLPNHSVSTLASAHEDTHCLYRIVGQSTPLHQAVDLAKRIAPTSAPVLINGESGTGKELMAYLIYRESKRAQCPYIRINCAALSDSLLESELFGHEKGAFTGAYTRRKGRFEMAHGGTLLLDEISETPISFQAKLLRVIEQQDFERVGGNESVKVNVRIISTTNKDLLQEVQKGTFRADLYYRLSGARLTVCPLRERKEDLTDLVWYFVNLYARDVNRHITALDPAMMDIFAQYHWPGNVRQLRNVVRTSLILGVGQTLSLADASWLFDELQPLPQHECDTNDASYEKHVQSESGLGGIPLELIEQRAIMDTLRQTGGNKTKAAKVLGISDRTLRDRIHRYRREGCLQPV
ncbi:MAG: sigma-54-dependent Fis family transcriptional regulator [Sedimentisphaerales bacterium]|nr:sigma-54-dependent Fis family transcriptional regulator [Sedimentisphaerales bacterium]